MAKTPEEIARYEEELATKLRAETRVKDRLRDEFDSSNRVVELESLQGITPIQAEWLWQHRVALGEFGLFAGREGFGKSTILADLTAKVTRGALEGALRGMPRAVIMCATEDSFEHTIVPRLLAAKADLSRVFSVKVSVSGRNGYLNLPTDVDRVAELSLRHEVALIILDPLTSRLSSRLDTHKDADVRIALEPLGALAKRTRSAILGVIHLNKSTAHTDPNNLIIGSRAFSAVSRYTLMVSEDPDVAEDDDPSYVLGQAKSSLGPKNIPILPYRLVGDQIRTDDDRVINTSRVEWFDDEEKRTFDEVFHQTRASANKEHASDEREGARVFLKSFLPKCPDGKALTSEVMRAAEGHNERTLRRAADDLGIKRNGRGPSAAWTWPVQDLPLGGDTAPIAGEKTPF